MKVITISVPDIQEYMDGSRKMLVDVYEEEKHLLRKEFSCLELAERWVQSFWPGVKEKPKLNPPEKIGDRYHDDPEVLWVGMVE